MYQSVAVCRSLSIRLVPAQTYLDDLESIFYVVTHLLFGFTRPATLVHNRTWFLNYWNSSDQELVAEAKNGYALNVLPLSQAPLFWGKPCRTFLKDLNAVIREILLKKVDIREDEDMTDDQRLDAYDELAEQGDTFFQQAKAAFDKVIAALEKEGLNAEELQVAAVVPSAPLSAPPATSTIVTLAEPTVTATPSALSARTDFVAGTLLSKEFSEASASKKRQSDNGAHEGAPSKRHRRDEATRILRCLQNDEKESAASVSRAVSPLSGKREGVFETAD